MLNVVDDIRNSINAYFETPPFYYGRSFDSALESYRSLNEDFAIYLDPITFTGGNVQDNLEEASITILFLKQDSPDSEHDKTKRQGTQLSMEEIIFEMKQKAIEWLKYYFENYIRYNTGTYTITPVYRVKNVCTGIGLSFTLTYNLGC